jgi:branched-subunit amino acid transport protein
MFGLALQAGAHQAATSYVTLTPTNLTWELETVDLALLVPLDANGDGRILYEEIKSARSGLDARLLQGLRVKGCRLQATNEKLFLVPRNSTFAVRWVAALSCEAVLTRSEVTIEAPFEVDAQHRVLLKTLGTRDVYIFSEATRTKTVDFVNESLPKTLLASIREGLHHIALGYDHLAFLFALLLPSVLRKKSEQKLTLKTCLASVVKVVTAFTLAHSITLGLAAFELVTPNLPRAEVLIALSVAVAALFNLLPFGSEARWPLAFSLGLLHGFGFVAALNELGASGSGRALSLFGFNVGVELGQLSIVALFVPLAFVLRETKFYQLFLVKVGSALILGVALFWVSQRI